MPKSTNKAKPIGRVSKKDGKARSWLSDNATPGMPSSLDVLMGWITQPVNAQRWRSGLFKKTELYQQIVEALKAQNIRHRTVDDVKDKMRYLNKRFTAATMYLRKEGQEEAFQRGEADESVKETALKLCPLYHHLAPAFGNVVATSKTNTAMEAADGKDVTAAADNAQVSNATGTGEVDSQDQKDEETEREDVTAGGEFVNVEKPGSAESGEEEKEAEPKENRNGAAEKRNAVYEEKKAQPEETQHGAGEENQAVERGDEVADESEEDDGSESEMEDMEAVEEEDTEGDEEEGAGFNNEHAGDERGQTVGAVGFNGDVEEEGQDSSSEGEEVNERQESGAAEETEGGQSSVDEETANDLEVEEEPSDVDEDGENAEADWEQIDVDEEDKTATEEDDHSDGESKEDEEGSGVEKDVGVQDEETQGELDEENGHSSSSNSDHAEETALPTNGRLDEESKEEEQLQQPVGGGDSSEAQSARTEPECSHSSEQSSRSAKRSRTESDFENETRAMKRQALAERIQDEKAQRHELFKLERLKAECELDETRLKLLVEKTLARNRLLNAGIELAEVNRVLPHH